MKTLLWSVAGLLAFLWSGLAWVCSALTQWTVQALASGQATELGRDVAAYQLPEWMKLFLDTGLLTFLQNALQWLIEVGSSSLPLVGSVVGWLVPLIWIVWGFGLVLLLGACGVMHLLINKLPRAGLPVVKAA